MVVVCILTDELVKAINNLSVEGSAVTLDGSLGIVINSLGTEGIRNYVILLVDINVCFNFHYWFEIKKQNFVLLQCCCLVLYDYFTVGKMKLDRLFVKPFSFILFCMCRLERSSVRGPSSSPG